MNHVQHFEIPYKVQPRAKKFYFEAFGWQLFDVPGTGYSFATTVPVEKNGMPKQPGAINGGLAPRSKTFLAPTVLVKVGDLRAHLARIEDAGGDIVVQPTAMGPVWYARIRDTEGNVIGVMQDRPEGQEGNAPAKPKAKASSGLTPKQRAQRKYAANMRAVRARAKSSKGGKGHIAKRSTATRMRHSLGLKPGKSSKMKR